MLFITENSQNLLYVLWNAQSRKNRLRHKIKHSKISRKIVIDANVVVLFTSSLRSCVQDLADNPSYDGRTNVL